MNLVYFFYSQSDIHIYSSKYLKKPLVNLEPDIGTLKKGGNAKVFSSFSYAQERWLCNSMAPYVWICLVLYTQPGIVGVCVLLSVIVVIC